MININNINKSEPYTKFIEFYKKALKSNQNNIEAICISSFNIEKNEVNSRFVNLKYINDKEFIFFSNYQSNKAQDFTSHTQVCGLFFWNSINTQIKIKCKIKKTDASFSDMHFHNRSIEKNTLAISSSQSSRIESYNEVIQKYKNTLKSITSKTKRPEYWGGFSLIPYYFEFWVGHESRINKREVYESSDSNWNNYFLEP